MTTTLGYEVSDRLTTMSRCSPGSSPCPAPPRPGKGVVAAAAELSRAPVSVCTNGPCSAMLQTVTYRFIQPTSTGP